MVYFIIFGDTMSEVFTQIVTGSDIAGIQSPEKVQLDLEGKNQVVRAFCSRSSFVILAAILLGPVLFKKEMREMKVFSYLLFLAVIVIILITGYDLWGDERTLSDFVDAADIATPKPGHGLISALAIISLAFIFHF